MKTLVSLLLFGVTFASAAPPPEKAEFPQMLPGYIHGYSKLVTGLGGHAKSDNYPQPAPKDLLAKEGIVLQADLEPRIYGDKYEGMTLYLVNATNKDAVFHAQDSRLSIIQQAQDAKGEWKDIEHLPSSWCGNSYHTVQLAPGECWAFSAPRYSGPVKTRLRFKMLRGKETPLYSNEFEGSIHETQFVAPSARP